MGKQLVPVLLGVLVAAMAVAAAVQDDDVPFTDKDLETEESIWNLYQRWRSVQASSSPAGLAESVRRFDAFKANARYVNEFNKRKDTTYELGLNKFADLTLEEFTAMYAGAKPDAGALFTSAREEEEDLPAVIGEAPAAWDWREHGAVTAVKDQRSCGSCWAFAAVGTVEGANAIATGKLVTLSEQQVLDCSGAGDCGGGWPATVLEDFAINKGIAVSQYYPAYDATKHECRTASNTPVVKTNSLVEVPVSEASLKLSVFKQPVSVAIEVDSNFQLYKSGVYSGPCGTKVNHGVVAVGYGVTSDGTKYWIVKNSWNTSWGEKGYIRMKRDVPAKAGLCGIALYGVYATKNTNEFTTWTDAAASIIADAAVSY